MAGKDMKNDIKVIAATGAIDTQGYESLTVAVVGADAGAINVALTEGDTADGNFTEVDAAHVIADAKTALAEAGQPYSVGYVGGKRFVKATLTGGANGTMVAVLGTASVNPQDAIVDAA